MNFSRMNQSSGESATLAARSLMGIRSRFIAKKNMLSADLRSGGLTDRASDDVNVLMTDQS